MASHHGGLVLVPGHCGICGEHNGTRTGSFLINMIFCCQLPFHQSCIITHLSPGWTVGPFNEAVPRTTGTTTTTDDDYFSNSDYVPLNDR